VWVAQEKLNELEFFHFVFRNLAVVNCVDVVKMRFEHPVMKELKTGFHTNIRLPEWR
jgi:hypothetical protein